MDVQGLNSQRVLTAPLLPEEEIITTPTDLPPLPLASEEAFNGFEDFLSNHLPLTCMVSLHTFLQDMIFYHMTAILFTYFVFWYSQVNFLSGRILRC